MEEGGDEKGSAHILNGVILSSMSTILELCLLTAGIWHVFLLPGSKIKSWGNKSHLQLPLFLFQRLVKLYLKPFSRTNSSKLFPAKRIGKKVERFYDASCQLAVIVIFTIYVPFFFQTSVTHED